jgi:Rhodopirellula transposase DDE domain
MFARDSPLEGDGFELPVPREETWSFDGVSIVGALQKSSRFDQNDPFLARGTDGSNPASSSEESAANAESLDQAALISLVEPTTRGDPESPLRWTCKSVRRLAQALQAQGHEVSRTLVAHLLNEAGYSLQGNRKTTEDDSKGLGRAVPYGIYDLATNSGWVSVGVDHDTAAFAVNSIPSRVLRTGAARH